MGHAEVVVHLISAGADPRLRDRLNLTALEWSTRRGFSDVSRFLTRVSPPLQTPRSERETDSKKTDSDTQQSASVTKDAEPAGIDPAKPTETTTAEQEAAVELPPPQPEPVGISTAEISSEPAAMATDPSTLSHEVDSPSEVEAKPELEPASVELATGSVTPPLVVDDSPALVANEPELKQVSRESEFDS